VAVRVSRRIAAPATTIFRLLADPGRHPELDGSGMLRGSLTTAPVSAVGDVFIMKMYFSELGDYEMNNHVVEYEQDRRIGWEPESGRGRPDAAKAQDDRRRGPALRRPARRPPHGTPSRAPAPGGAVMPGPPKP
jgi:hypothetical protein